MEELELTYLPKYLPKEVLDSPSKEILDIYIPSSSNHPRLRIRHSGDKYEITKKEPIVKGDASHQLETTIPITKEEFSDLSKIPGKRVVKTRYYFQENKVNYEVDLFQGELKGLVLVDIEFKSVEDKSNFVAPNWLLHDVTQEEFIAGGMLCGKSYSDLQEKLKSFGYSKLEI